MRAFCNGLMWALCGFCGLVTHLPLVRERSVCSARTDAKRAAGATSMASVGGRILHAASLSEFELWLTHKKAEGHSRSAV